MSAAAAAHDKDINALAVAPNDTLVATASQDRTAKARPAASRSALCFSEKEAACACRIASVPLLRITHSVRRSLRWQWRLMTCWTSLSARRTTFRGRPVTFFSCTALCWIVIIRSWGICFACPHGLKERLPSLSVSCQQSQVTSCDFGGQHGLCRAPHVRWRTRGVSVGLAPAGPGGRPHAARPPARRLGRRLLPD